MRINGYAKNADRKLIVSTDKDGLIDVEVTDIYEAEIYYQEKIPVEKFRKTMRKAIRIFKGRK